MNLNLVLILLFIVVGLILQNNETSKKRKLYIYICCTILILSAALRNLAYGSEGSDTMNYYDMFKNIRDYSWAEIWQLFVMRYIASVGEGDIGFFFLMKVISYVTSSFHTFTFLAELLFFIPFGMLLYRFSDRLLDLVFAFIFYTIMIHTHAMTGTRQFYAMGFGIMVFLFYNRKQYKYMFISLLLGLTIHLSLLLVVIPCALAYLKPRQLKSLHLGILLIFPVVMMMPNEIISFMGNMVGSEKYAQYGADAVAGGTETFIFLLELLSLTCLVGIKRNSLDLSDDIKQLYAMIPCFTFFGPLIYSNGSMIRISMYSYLYLTLLLPLAVRGFAKDSYKPVLWMMIISLSMLSLRGGSYIYHFFWNVDPVSTW